MKRIVLLLTVITIVIALTGCPGLLPEPATPLEQVQGFLQAASAEPQNPEAMKAYFDDAASDYGSMQLQSYWDARFFNPNDGPYGIVGAETGGTDPDIANSTLVTGRVTNSISPTDGYEATFVLTTDPDVLFADPLIRKITVTVGTTDEVIEKIIP